MTKSSDNPNLTRQLAELATNGYTIIENFLDADRLRRVRAGLAPFLNSHHGRNNFEGVKTERVYTLVGRGKIFEEIVEDQRVLDILDALLLPNYLLTASQAICISPGETPQPIHSDDTFYPIPRPRPAISFSTIVAVDTFTATNGCTEIIPGSHLWSDAEIAGVYDGLDHDTLAPAAIEKMLVPMIIPAGSCLVFQGTLLHRGGANRSNAARLAFSNQYCEPWARTQENFYFGLPPALAREMSPRLQAMLGYSIVPPFMGHVTASHPSKVFKNGYVNAVQSDRALIPPDEQ